LREIFARQHVIDHYKKMTKHVSFSTRSKEMDRLAEVIAQARREVQ
jgi:hypothetical protein